MRAIRLTHKSGAELHGEVGEEPLIIGRSHKEADFVCDWDDKMSRRHGHLWFADGTLWYEDLGSFNGSWSGQERLTKRIDLGKFQSIMLGETYLTALPLSEAQTVEDGMTLQLRQKVSRQDFAGSLKEASERPDVLSTLASFVETLLGASDLDTIAPSLILLYDHLPTAKHIFLIAPPLTQEPIRHLIPPQKLSKEKDEVEGLVSRSLAKMALARGEALLFSQSRVADPAVRDSAKLKGIKSAVYVPLISTGGEPLGVLCVDSPMSTIPLRQQNFQLLKSAGALVSARLEGENLRKEALTKEREARDAELRQETLANFLKIASHDLKNPLTVIRMCGVLMDRLSQDEQMKSLAGRLLDSGRRAEQLIASYLEVSELQTTQKLTLSLEPVTIRELIECEFQFLEKASEGTNRIITLDNRADDLEVVADKQKLEQIFNNLISNAIKYGSCDPTIIASTEIENERIVFGITDDGIGISHEDQRLLFQQFQRVKTDKNIPGSGLGLWLSSLLVQAHGGEMWLESSLGEGSTFYFSLPK